VQRRVAIKAIEAVAGEHCTVGSRDRDATLRVEAQGEVGYETIHAPPNSPFRQRAWRKTPGAARRAGPRWRCPRVQPYGRLGFFGISWDLMVVNQTEADARRSPAAYTPQA